jgi:hypothetical protein
MTGPDGSEVCTSTEEPSTFGGPMMGGPDEGFSSFFAFFAVLVVVVGIVGTFWKVSTARRLAEQSGMDPNDATAMTLLTDNGLEATYVASQVRQGTSRPAGVPAAERLRELEELRKQGLITAAEYAERREVIVKSL